ncbi:MAG: hypothetical protein R2830_18270 [Saprospiraceae bacterium]
MHLTRLFMFFTAMLLVSCTNSNTQNTTKENAEEKAVETPAVTEPVAIDTVVTPDGYQKLGQAAGDLDKDGTDEQAFVFDTGNNTDLGTERVLQIFKNSGNTWTLWHKSIGAVLPSESGGVLGDPFQEVKIENGCIVISHFGGSREKWAYTHRFRFQDGSWQLIGATVNNGAPCEQWENIDYNLSTGKIKYEKEIENCEGGEDNVKTTKETKDFVKKLPVLPAMDGFRPGENKLMLPGLKAQYYY